MLHPAWGEQSCKVGSCLLLCALVFQPTASHMFPFARKYIMPPECLFWRHNVLLGLDCWSLLYYLL